MNIRSSPKALKQLDLTCLSSCPAKDELIDRLLFSLDRPDSTIDRLWAKEAENRIDAYDRGEIASLSLEEVMERYK